ncbi:MAG TPA: Spy/CpxP family protein refolding chaperone [Terriglobales bacterium]|nr:Spy/CpxP family protein refolding chaperone [Terriglobales bacterium]
MTSNRWKVMFAVLMVGWVAIAAVGQTTSGVAAHGRGGFGRMLGFYTDYLDLTDAQQAQMKDIMTKEKPTIQPLMQQLAASRRQLEQLQSASPLDEAAVLSVATQQSQTMTQLIVRKAHIKNEMMQVLTADQKAKLAKFAARRQQRFQRHMQAPAENP